MEGVFESVCVFARPIQRSIVRGFEKYLSLITIQAA